MKKYRQLCLIIISILSVILLLFYRHEYLRLRYVLEILNFFGTPTKPELFPTNSTVLYSTAEWGPTPAWQQINNDYFVYSAHWSDDEVRAIAVGKTTIGIKLTCNLLHSNETKPVMGKFGFSILTQGDVYSTYIFICRRKKFKQVPYAVSFLDSSYIPVRNSTVNDKKYNLTVCVKPSRNTPDVSKIIDFIAYNQILGADGFIFYENTMPSQLSLALHKYSEVLKYGITYFPWNFPNINDHEIDDIIEYDCLRRASDNSQMIVILSINDFIVPRFSTTIMELLENFKGSKLLNKFAITRVTFCVDSNHKHSFLTSTQFIKNNDLNQREFHIHWSGIGSKNIVSTQVLSNEMVALHTYQDCQKQTMYYDASALKFLNRINIAKLKILYDTGALFSS